MEPFDYRALLVKYICHVGDVEGSDFVSYAGESYCEVKFTDQEIDELRAAQNDAY